MFAATVINFILSSFNTGTEVARFVVFIRKPSLILDIDDLLSRKHNNALWKVNTLSNWAIYLPVSIRLSLSDLVSIHVRWRYYSTQ